MLKVLCFSLPWMVLVQMHPAWIRSLMDCDVVLCVVDLLSSIAETPGILFSLQELSVQRKQLWVWERTGVSLVLNGELVEWGEDKQVRKGGGAGASQTPLDQERSFSEAVVAEITESLCS